MHGVGHQHIDGRIRFRGTTVSRCFVAQFVEVARAVHGLGSRGGDRCRAARGAAARRAGRCMAVLAWRRQGLDQRPMLDADARLRGQAFDALGVGEPLRLRHHSRDSNRLRRRDTPRALPGKWTLAPVLLLQGGGRTRNCGGCSLARIEAFAWDSDGDFGSAGRRPWACLAGLQSVSKPS